MKERSSQVRRKQLMGYYGAPAVLLFPLLWNVFDPGTPARIWGFGILFCIAFLRPVVFRSKFLLQMQHYSDKGMFRILYLDNLGRQKELWINEAEIKKIVLEKAKLLVRDHDELHILTQPAFQKFRINVAEISAETRDLLQLLRNEGAPAYSIATNY